MFKLRYSDAISAVWDSLPAEASEALSLALADVCEDPYGKTVHRLDGDPVKGSLILDHVVVALIILDAPPIQRIYIRHIDYLG